MNSLGQIALILVFMAGAAFFAGIETGVISMNRLRLRHLVRHKVPGADVMDYFLRDPDHLLGTTLVGTNLCHVAASVLAADLGARWFGAAGTTGVTVLMVLSVLVFCEYLPKAWFQSCPTLRALPFARFLKLCGRILFPISWTMTLLPKLLFPAGSRDRERDHAMITREELLHLAGEGRQAGTLSESESRMIHTIFELRGTTCGEIMVPKKAVVYVDTTTSVEEILRLARTREFNRFPVYDPVKKNFAGIVHMFDVISDSAAAGKTAADYMRPPQFVSHNTPADHVLPRMRVTRQPLVMVLDDRYDFVGIVTIEDVLEEVVGQL